MVIYPNLAARIGGQTHSLAAGLAKKKAGGLSGVGVIPVSPLQSYLQKILISSSKLTFKNKGKNPQYTHAEAL